MPAVDRHASASSNADMVRAVAAPGPPDAYKALPRRVRDFDGRSAGRASPGPITDGEAEIPAQGPRSPSLRHCVDARIIAVSRPELPVRYVLHRRVLSRLGSTPAPRDPARPRQLLPASRRSVPPAVRASACRREVAVDAVAHPPDGRQARSADTDGQGCARHTASEATGPRQGEELLLEADAPLVVIGPRGAGRPGPDCETLAQGHHPVGR
jgi:hypothetical protein